jgi:thioredoxin reductase (NADPH)
VTVTGRNGATDAREFDLAIIGSGAAGMTAALYAARARRSTVLFEGGVLGGQIANSEQVENYPGFPDGINGFDLAMAMHRQAEKFGVETVYARVTDLRVEEPYFDLETDGAGSFRAKAVIVTAGADYNRLGVPGEDLLTGRGVSYCATCDAAFFRDQDVIVVGGGDSATEEAVFTARYARRVTLVHRREELRAQRVLQERVFANDRVDFAWNTVVEEIHGTDSVEGVTVRDLVTGDLRRLDVTGVFVFIGQTPNSGLLRGLVELDEGGHAITNPWMETEVPGLFVAGDVRSQAARQLVSAAGDGATAAICADHYIGDHFDG